MVLPGYQFRIANHPMQPTGGIVMFKNYANAKNVLPEELFNRLKAEFTGLLYVPGNSGRVPANVQLVLSMVREGMPRAKIAATLGISPRRVNQIVAKHRQEAEQQAAD